MLIIMRILCVFVLLLAVCCKSNSKQENGEAMQEEAFATEEPLTVLSPDYPECKNDIRLGDIADSVFYISLKRGKMEVLQLYYLDSLILLNDINCVYIFDSEGNVKCEIPLQAGCFDVSPDMQRLYTYQFLTKEIGSYDFDGNNIWRTKVKYSNSKNELGYYGYSFLSVNDTLFAISNINFGNNQDKLIFVNRHGRAVHNVMNNERFTPPNSVYSTNRAWQRPLFRDYDGICYHSSCNDTLFSIDAETLEQSPAVIEQKLPKAPLKRRLEYTGEKVEDFYAYCTNTYTCSDSYQDIWTDSSKYATRFFNTSRYLIVGYTHGSLNLPTSNFLLYDRKTKTLSRTHNDLGKSIDAKFLHFGIFNDYDGGLSFEPEHQSGDYLIMVNAGASQGGMRHFPKELYFEGRKIVNDHCICRSNVYQNARYKERLDNFFTNEVDSKNNTVLTVVKLKTK
jgi:hypothetical protein